MPVGAQPASAPMGLRCSLQFSCFLACGRVKGPNGHMPAHSFKGKTWMLFLDISYCQKAVTWPHLATGCLGNVV